MDVTTILSAILTVIKKIQEVRAGVKCNKKRCSRLGQRVETVLTVINSLKQKQKDLVEGVKYPLEQLLKVLNEAAIFMSKFMEKKWVVKAWQYTADGEVFVDLHEDIKDLMLTLSVGVGIDTNINLKAKLERQKIAEKVEDQTDQADDEKESIALTTKLCDKSTMKPELKIQIQKQVIGLSQRALQKTTAPLKPKDDLIATIDKAKKNEIQFSKHAESRNVTWKESDEIGGGTFGTVYLGTWRNNAYATSKTAAVKVFKDKSSATVKYEATKEASILQFIAEGSHPNIVVMYGANVRTTPYFIVYELAVCNLNDSLFSQKRTGSTATTTIYSIARGELKKKLRILQEIASACFYLHQLNIAHCDMKSQNILLTSTGTVKLCDFGSAKIVTTGDFIKATQSMQGIRGTPLYVAPEIWNAQSEIQIRYSENTDMYSFGILMNEILDQDEPFFGESYSGLLDKVRSGVRPHLFGRQFDESFLILHGLGIVNDLQTLTKLCWHENPLFRPSFQNVFKYLERYLNINPPITIPDYKTSENITIEFEETDDKLVYTSSSTTSSTSSSQSSRILEKIPKLNVKKWLLLVLTFALAWIVYTIGVSIGAAIFNFYEQAENFQNGASTDDANYSMLITPRKRFFTQLNIADIQEVPTAEKEVFSYLLDAPKQLYMVEKVLLPALFKCNSTICYEENSAALYTGFEELYQRCEIGAMIYPEMLRHHSFVQETCQGEKYLQMYQTVNYTESVFIIHEILQLFPKALANPLDSASIGLIEDKVRALYHFSGINLVQNTELTTDESVLSFPFMNLYLDEFQSMPVEFIAESKWLVQQNLTELLTLKKVVEQLHTESEQYTAFMVHYIEEMLTTGHHPAKYISQQHRNQFHEMKRSTAITAFKELYKILSLSATSLTGYWEQGLLQLTQEDARWESVDKIVYDLLHIQEEWSSVWSNLLPSDELSQHVLGELTMRTEVLLTQVSFTISPSVASNTTILPFLQRYRIGKELLTTIPCQLIESAENCEVQQCSKQKLWCSTTITDEIFNCLHKRKSVIETVLNLNAYISWKWLIEWRYLAAKYSEQSSKHKEKPVEVLDEFIAAAAVKKGKSDGGIIQAIFSFSGIQLFFQDSFADYIILLCWYVIAMYVFIELAVKKHLDYDKMDYISVCNSVERSTGAVFVLLTIAYSLFCFTFGVSIVRSFGPEWRYSWVFLYFVFSSATIFAPRMNLHYIYKVVHSCGAVAIFCGTVPIETWRDLLQTTLSNSWMDLYHYIYCSVIVVQMILESTVFVVWIDAMLWKKASSNYSHANSSSNNKNQLIIASTDYLSIEPLIVIHVLYFGCLSCIFGDCVQMHTVLSTTFYFQLPSVLVFLCKCSFTVSVILAMYNVPGYNNVNNDSVHINTMLLLVPSMIVFQSPYLFMLGVVTFLWSLYTVQNDATKQRSILEGSGIAMGVFIVGIIIEIIYYYVLTWL